MRTGLTEEQQKLIVDLYVKDRVKPVEIANRLGLKHHQPIYNFLKKEGLFIKHSTGSNITRKYGLDEGFFEVIDTEEKAYILGFIAADGYIDEDHNRVVIVLNRQDIDIIHKIKTACHSDHKVYEFVKDGKYDHCGIKLNSARLVKSLVEKGLTVRKSLTLSSDILKHVPEVLMRHFLRGFFEGDGHVTYGAKYSSGTKYAIIIIGPEEFLRNSFGKYCTTNSPITKYSSCNMYRWVTSKKSHVDAFLTYIYKDATIYLERKHSVYCAHVKPQELLETPRGDQQPSLCKEEGSETIEKTVNSGTE